MTGPSQRDGTVIPSADNRRRADRHGADGRARQL